MISLEQRLRGGGRIPAEGDRLRLFREGRLATAAVGLVAFPALAVAESWPVAAGLLLCGLLPAAIALDCRRPEGLDRAAGMALVAAAAVLAGATIGGLPIALALAFVAIQAMEALVVSGRMARTVAVAGCAFAAVASVGYAASSAGGQAMAAAVSTLMLMLTVNAGMLVRGLLASQTELGRHAAEDRIQAGEIEAVMAETVIAVDRSGAVVRVSANAARVLGLPADAIAGRGLAELILVADRPELLTALRDCAHGAGARRLRARMRASLDGAPPRYRSVEFAIVPGSEGMALASLRDVSEAVAEEEARARLAAESEAASRARAAFLSTVNHELRTPLNAIIGFSEIIANPATTPANAERLREYAKLINGAGQDLLRIVTAMIDITRLDSGVYEFEAEPADLAAAVVGAVEAFKLEAESATDIVMRPSSDSIEALIDNRAFRAVMHQLLSNAVKFGGSSAVTVASGFDGDWAKVTVADRGPGLAPDKLAQIGRHFARVDEGLARERGGVGLGLSLAAGLMALHGGRMQIRSEPGEGTIVTLLLPRAGAPAPASNVRALQQRPPRAPAAEPQPTRNLAKRRA